MATGRRDPGKGRARIRGGPSSRGRTGGSSGAYGVVNDGGTNDGSFLEASTDTSTASVVTVPALVETPAFRTELVLANRGSGSATLTLDYRESLSPSFGAGGSGDGHARPARAADRPGRPSVHLRGLGVAAGPAGAARVRGPPPRDVPGRVRPGRLPPSGSPRSSPGGGTYGVFLPGVASGDEAKDEAVVPGLRAEPDIRSNVAFVHAGAAGSGPLNLEVRFFDGEAGGAPQAPP